MFNELASALKDKPVLTRCTEDSSPVYVWSDGEKILCESELVINLIADFFDSAGYEAVTGYYDPEEDAKNGDTDKYTGNYYVDV